MTHAPTLSDLVDEVLDYLLAFTNDQEQAVTLTSQLTVNGLSLQVSKAENINRGFVEVGDELIYVESVDKSVRIASVPPWGRGQRGTLAVQHEPGARVTIAPSYPRHRIKTQINTVVLSLYPDLFAVKTAAIPTSAAVSVYALPADCRQVIGVSYESIGPSRSWVPVRRFLPDLTQQTIDVGNAIPAGRPMRVTYLAPLTTFTSDQESLTSTGLSESCRDIVVMGTVSTMLPALESGRLQSTTVEQSTRALDAPPGAASAASRRMREMFDMRVAQERKRLLTQYPRTASIRD